MSIKFVSYELIVTQIEYKKRLECRAGNNSVWWV